MPWTKELLELKTIIEKETGETFNSCLLNLYHHGEEGMAWHSDGERDLKRDGAIGSLSFGAERKFAFKHKQTKEKSRVGFGTRQLVGHERHYPNALATPITTQQKNHNTESELDF